MIAATHLLAGAAIATALPYPVISLPLAIVSHYALDSIPHREYDTPHRRIVDRKARLRQFFFDSLKLLVDAGGGLLAVVVLSHGNPLIIATALIAFMPDGLHILDDIVTRRRGGVYAAYGTTPYTANDPFSLRILGAQRRLHMAVHWRDRADVPRVLGWSTQAVITVLLLIFLQMA